MRRHVDHLVASRNGRKDQEIKVCAQKHLYHAGKKHGVSEAAIYIWRKRFGGMDVSDARRLRELEAENARLKKIVAQQMLDHDALKDLLSKKW